MAQKFGSFQGTNNVMYLNHNGSVSTGDIWFDHGNSAIKIYNGTSWDEVGSGSGGGGVSYSVSTSNVTATANQGIIADTSGGSFTVTLPASPSTGDKVFIADGADFATNNLTVARNGSTIEGASEDFILDVGGPNVGFIYDGTTWQVYPQSGLMSIRGIEDNSTSTAITINSSQDVSFSGNVTLGYVDGDFYVTDSSTTDGYVQIGEKYIYGLDNVGGGSFNIQSNGASYFTGGNVGIGTTSPSRTLDIQGNSSTNIPLVVRSGSGQTNGFIAINDPNTTSEFNNRIGSVGNDMVFHTSGVEKVRIDSSGNVGIGATSPQRTFHVSSGATNVVTRFESTDSVAVAEFKDDTGTVEIGCSGNNVILAPAGVERMRINSDGNVGIGISTSFTAGGSRRILQISNGTNGALIAMNNSSDESLNPRIFSDSVNLGFATANTGSGVFQFYTAGSERVRIDSSGNLLVGKTSDNITVVGAQVQADGALLGTRASGQPMTLNRTGSDGDIAQFRHDGTTIGSIASHTNKLEITGSGSNTVTFGHAQSTTVGAGLYSWHTSNALVPYNSAGHSIPDGVQSLGHSSYRWKDLYLSGGAYLGGTGSANKLDDYEEGTFTPTLYGATTAGTTTYVGQNGHYTKIGRMVTIVMILQWSNATGTGSMRVGGLPFSSDNGLTENYSVGSILPSAVNWTGGSALLPLQFQGQTFIQIYYVGDDANAAAQQMVNEAANMRITLTYFTAA